MKRRLAIAATAILGLAEFACSKRDQTEELPAGHRLLVLEGLDGLKVQVPEGTKAGKAPVGDGVMLTGPGVSTTISPSNGMDGTDLEVAKKNAADYEPTDITGEELPDGYILTYKNRGNMGDNYWLVGRRKVDGRAYTCGVASPREAHQRSGIAICKSLSK